MFDSNHAAAHYDYDTIVVEVEEAEEEDQVQLLVLSVWHRRTPDLGATACGILYHSQFTPTRRTELRGELCPTCHTDYERSRAEYNNSRDTSRTGP